MKQIFVLFLVTLLCLSFCFGFSAEEISPKKAGWMSYDEYFSENRPLPRNGEYRYSYAVEQGGRPDKNSQVNGEYGDNFISFNVSDDSDGSIGEILIKKKNGTDFSTFSLGTGYRYPLDRCGYLYTVRGGEFSRWNKATWERDVVYFGTDQDVIEILFVSDEIAFFRVGAKIYRYYGPSRTLEMVLEGNRIGTIYPTENNVIVISMYSEDYMEFVTAAGWDFKDETVLSRHPKDFEAFYSWVNEKYSLCLTVPTIAERTEKYDQFVLKEFLAFLNLNVYEVTEGYDLKSQSFLDGYVIRGGISIQFPTSEYNPMMDGIVPLPDVSSPWLGTSVEGLPSELMDAMEIVPTGAFWGEYVTTENLLYTSLGNNQARVLLRALMRQQNMIRPEKRELLTQDAQKGKERISAEEVKALMESLYGVGSADILLSSDVIGDANAGDLLLKTEDGDYVYCWAPYAGSELNAEQYIKYLSHETEGKTLNIYTAYGYYRLDDGRKTYKLYGDARSLRLLEEELSSPIAVGSVEDGFLDNLRSGELDGALSVYKHTFVQNADGSYGWISSEPYLSQDPTTTVEGKELLLLGGISGSIVVVLVVVTGILSKKKKTI